MNFKPNLKALSFNAALVTALATAGSTWMASSAVAATITPGSKLNLSEISTGGVNFVSSPTPKLDFFPNVSLFGTPLGQPVGIGASTGTFAGATSLPLPLAQIKDIDLVAMGGGVYNLAAPITNFLSGIDIGGIFTGPPGGDDVQFDLTEFVFNSTTGDSTLLKGIFKSGSFSIAGIGRLTSQTNLGSPSSYSLSITAVPTPALLPGLLGFGVAALRKRKLEAAAVEADAEGSV